MGSIMSYELTIGNGVFILEKCQSTQMELYRDMYGEEYILFSDY